MLKQKSLLFLIIPMTFAIVACGAPRTSNVNQNAAMQAEEPNHTDSLFSQVGKYSYGDSFEKIGEELLSANGLSSLKSYDLLIDSDNQVAGYSAKTTYYFDDKNLCGASYEFDDLTDADKETIRQKYMTKYGEPSLYKESTGWGDLYLWMDDSTGNIVFLDGYNDVDAHYAQINTSYYDEMLEWLDYFHEVNLNNDINKYDTDYLDGI